MKRYHLILIGLACVILTSCGSERLSTSHTSAEAGRGPRYFVALYGYQGQGRLNLPRRSHTWARFATFENSRLSTAQIDEFTISWLAADANVGMFQGIEPGRNFTHGETMAIAAHAPVNVQRTPYIEIDAEMFANAVYRHDTLTNGSRTGRVKYKMIDDANGRRQILSGRAGGYTNCIHGVSDLAAQTHGGLLDTGRLRGFDASYAVFDWLRQGVGVIDTHGANDGIVAQRLATE